MDPFPDSDGTGNASGGKPLGTSFGFHVAVGPELIEAITRAIRAGLVQAGADTLTSPLAQDAVRGDQLGDKLLDADAAAAILGVTRRRVLALYRQGKLRAVAGVTNGLRFWRSHVLEDWRAKSLTVQARLDAKSRRRRDGA